MSVDTAGATSNADNTYAVEVVGSAPQAQSQSGVTFHNVLSALNPLQYLPVVGTIYRAVTGDTIPEPVRELGSLAVSGLMGGPVGLAINIGLFTAEKLTGIDPDTLGQHLLADLGIGGGASAPGATGTAAGTASGTASAQTASAAAPAGTTAAPAAGAVSPSSAAPSPAATASPDTGRAWSTTELAAYGVKQTIDGGLTQGTVHGADVLNGLMLSRLSQGRLPLQTAA